MDPGLERIDDDVINRLAEHLRNAPDEEVNAYFSIVG